LGSALFAERQGNNRLKSQSLTRALSALTALQLGVNTDQAIAPALIQLYDSARRSVLDSVLTFNSNQIEAIRNDFMEIGAAMLR
jgi:flagellin-specific chaperone FliS